MSSQTISLINIVLQIFGFGVQFLALVGLGIYVWKTWEMADATRAAVQASENSLKELREARDQENAPYVVVFFDVPSDTRSLDLVIKNIGRTFATDIHISFDPPFESSYQDMFDRLLPKTGIPAIAPGYEIRTALDFFPEYKKSGKSMEFEVTVEFRGVMDSRLRRLSYRQDLMLYRGTMQITRKTHSETFSLPLTPGKSP